MSDPELLALVARHEMLATLDRPTLDKVLQVSKRVRMRPNRTLVKAGTPSDWLYCLLRGAVRVFHKDEQGGEILVKLFRAPAILCEMEVLSEVPVLPNARTLEESDFLFIPAEVFRQLVRTQPRLTQVVIFDLARRLCVTSDQQRALGFADVERRLANLLLDYGQLAGKPLAEGTLIDLRLSQEGLAHDLGVSRKAVGMALTRLKEAGLLGRHQARFVIRDVAALTAKSSRGLGLAHKLGASLRELELPKPPAAELGAGAAAHGDRLDHGDDLDRGNHNEVIT
jgi:CRP-like cAMP-binding protein